MTNHELGFRPSGFSALEACIRFERKELAELSPEAARGTRFHDSIVSPPPLAESDLAKATTYAWEIIRACQADGYEIVAHELELDILDGATTGTADLVMRRENDFILIDWKTGMRRDYQAQLSAYAIGIYDKFPEAEHVRPFIAFVDQEQTDELTVNYPIASERISNLYQKWSHKHEYKPTINPYCDRCAIRPDCSAWRAEGEYALSRAADLAPQAGPLSTAAIDHLKSSPSDLETFVAAFERLKTLVEDDWALKAALKTHVETGWAPSQFTLVKIAPKETISEIVDSEEFLQKVLKKIGTSRAAQAINVDAAKAREMWSSYTTDKFPIAVTQQTQTKGGYSYLRLKPKKHDQCKSS